MTHPKARTKPHARDARSNPKRYRLTPAGLAHLERHAPASALVSTCVYCGCTDERACPGGCSWAIVDYDTRRGICSNCTGRLLAATAQPDHVAAKNRQAFASLRALNNALIVAGISAPPGAGKR